MGDSWKDSAAEGGGGGLLSEETAEVSVGHRDFLLNMVVSAGPSSIYTILMQSQLRMPDQRLSKKSALRRATARKASPRRPKETR